MPVLVLGEKLNGAYRDTPAKKVYERAEWRGFFIRDDWRAFQKNIIHVPSHNRSKSPYVENLREAFERESGLLIWTGTYRGGLQGIGLDFIGLTPEEMVVCS